jgi:hypothetical protein
MLATRMLICLGILTLAMPALFAHEVMQIAQAGNEQSSPAATPTPSNPAPA